MIGMPSGKLTGMPRSEFTDTSRINKNYDTKSQRDPLPYFQIQSVFEF